MEYMYADNSAFPPSRNEDYKASPTISGVPQQFIDSMKTLFEILDDAGIGLVPLAEIERRWRDDAVPNLPGVLDCLRAVAPVDGLLSFDTFVWGLRKALSRARQCKDRNKQVDFSTNVKTSVKGPAAEGYDVNALPSYYYQQKSARGETKLPVSMNLATDKARGESQTTRPMDNARFGHRPVNSAQSYAWPSRESRPFKPGHRRSSSGPITTAKVLPSPKRDQWPRDSANDEEGRVTKMGYATKFAAQPSKTENVSDKENDELLKSSIAGKEPEELNSETSGDKSSLSLKSDANRSDTTSSENSRSIVVSASDRKMSVETSPELAEKSDLDKLTANTLFISTGNHSNKPIGLSGKYVGITGTMQRNKAASCIPKSYSSLRRPARTSKAPASEQSFSRAEAEKGRSRNSSRHCKKDRNFSKAFQHYASAGESGDDSHKRTVSSPSRTSSSERKRAASVTNEKTLDPGGNSDRSGRRSGSGSPPERPAQKTPRSSTCPDFQSSTSESVEDGARAPYQQTTLKRLLQPPPSGRNVTGRATVVTSNGDDQTNKNTPVYATVGRRRNAASKRREPRRHTVANGIDYSMLKSMKLLEQEKDLILQGLDSLDRGRNWFQLQLNNTQEKQRHLSTSGNKTSNPHGGAGSPSHDSETSQKRLDSLVTKISEMTRLLRDLTDSKYQTTSDDVTTDQNSPINPRVVTALREQNHILMKEVVRQAEKISQLENEKSALVQQIFETKAQAQGSSDQPVNTSIFI